LLGNWQKYVMGVRLTSLAVVAGECDWLPNPAQALEADARLIRGFGGQPPK